MKKTILLVAYQCGDGMGSVSQIGWEWYSRLSRDYKVTLVTHVRNRQAIEASGLVPSNAEILYIDTEWFAAPLYRLAKSIFPLSEHSVFLLSSLDYYVFDFVVYRQLRRMLKQGRNWSLFHRVTPVTLAAPTWLCRLGIPGIIGPLNSGLHDPKGFSSIMRKESTWLIPFRKISNLFDLLIGSTRRVSRILVANRVTLQGVPRQFHVKCRQMVENSVDLIKFSPSPWPRFPNKHIPLRVLFVGRLIPLKSLDLLIRAIARLLQSGHAVELEVVGEGPMRSEWEALVDELGIETAVHFAGMQTHQEVARHMHACHVFCLPSIRESGGAVLLEAMAIGRPVIAIDYGGPAEIVDNLVGHLIAANSPHQIEDDLVQCLLDVIKYPERWRKRAEIAPARVQQLYSWDAKMTLAKTHYKEILKLEGV